MFDAVAKQRSAALHSSCPIRPRAPARPPKPTEQRPIGDPAGLSYFTARRSLTPQHHPELLALAKHASGRLPKQVLRELLGAVSVPGATADHLRGARRFIDSPFFQSSDRSAQLDLIRSYARFSASDPLRQAVTDLFELQPLKECSPGLRRLLLRFASGPQANAHSHAAHTAHLQAAWADRVRNLKEGLNDASPQEQGELDEWVADLLHRVDRPFHILRTVSDLDLLTLVFGSPEDPQSHSYARFYAYGRDGHAEATVVSPDPRVGSGWQGSTPLVEQLFEVRSTQLSRLEELELLRWIENNHAIGPDDTFRASGVPLAEFGHARRLADAVEPIANMIASGRGPLTFKRTLTRRGRPAQQERRRLRAALAQAATAGA